MSGRHTFASKAQQRWAFATHQAFAQRWGENTELAGKEKRLPTRTGAPSPVRKAKAAAKKAGKYR